MDFGPVSTLQSKSAVSRLLAEHIFQTSFSSTIKTIQHALLVLLNASHNWIYNYPSSGLKLIHLFHFQLLHCIAMSQIKHKQSPSYRYRLRQPSRALPLPIDTMMKHQEPSTHGHVGVNAKDMQLRRLHTSRQRPIVSVLHKRERSGCIDVDKQGPPALKLKLKRFEAAAATTTAAGMATSQLELSPSMNSDADFEANTKQGDLSGSGGMFRWFTNDADQDPVVTFSNCPSFASFVSGSSSDNFTNYEEAKQPSLLPSVSLEAEDSSTVINSGQLLNRNYPVFEEDILDSATLNPSAFIFDKPTNPMKATCSFLDLDLDGDQMGISSILDPSRYSTPESAIPAVKESSTNLVTPESLKLDDGKTMTIDMLDVADAASMDLMDDPLIEAYIFDSSTSSENEMTVPHQSSKKRETDKISVRAWRDKFDELRGECLVCCLPVEFVVFSFFAYSIDVVASN